jgi:hypothetical protein
MRRRRNAEAIMAAMLSRPCHIGDSGGIDHD